MDQLTERFDGLLRYAARAEESLEAFVRDLRTRLLLASYLQSDRRPWRLGYGEYKMEYLRSAVHDEDTLQAFRENRRLPNGFGFRLDARVVEIPWVLSRVAHQSGRLLDSGSSLNHEFLLTAPSLSGKNITIVTLAPETQCYWNLGVSYVFGDLRNLDFRSDLFDTIVCISTIEHVGMDNSMYASDQNLSKRGNLDDFLLVVGELRRVLKPDGALYITVPFGRYEDHGWFQQFDSRLLEALISAFHPSDLHESVFRYTPDGWTLSDRASCENCQYFDVHAGDFGSSKGQDYAPDCAAAERAVACLELFK